MIILQAHQNVKVISRLADKMAKSGRLYWLIRELDDTGKGRHTFVIELAAKYFDVNVKTIYKYLNQGKSLGYYKDYTLHRDGTVTVIYNTYKKIASDLNINDLGQVVFCDRKQMRNFKPSLTQAEMRTKQFQSEYQAKSENKSRLGRVDADYQNLDTNARSVLEASGEVRTKWRGPKSIFDLVKKKKKTKQAEQEKARPILKDKPTVDISDNLDGNTKAKKKRQNKAILHVGSRYAIVTNNFIPFGATQLAISVDMNRAVSTIRNRLKGIDRRQIITVLPISPDEARYHISTGSCDRFIRIHDEVVYEMHPNVYDFKGIETASGKKVNNRYKKYLLRTRR